MFNRFFNSKKKTSQPKDSLASVIADLELIQKSRLNDHPWLKGVDPSSSVPDEIIDRFYRNMFDAYKGTLIKEENFTTWRAEIAKKIAGKPFSRLESPEVHAWLQQMQKNVDEACDRRGIKPRKIPVFGTLQTGRIQGTAINLDNPDYYLILLDDGIMGFANLFAKIVAMLFEFQPSDDGNAVFSSDPENMKRIILSKEEVRARYFDLITAYVIEGAPHAAEQYLLEGEQQYITSVVRDSMEYFIFGHEYGHCAAGHLEEGNRKSLHMTPNKNTEAGDIDTIIPSDWQGEIEADMTGLVIAMDIMMNKGLDLTLSFLGVDLVFRCINYLERAIDILEFGETQERVLDTHPPSLLRQSIVRTALQKGSPENASNEAMQLADHVGGAMDLLQGGMESILLKMHSDGIRPNKRWSPKPKPEVNVESA